MFDNLVKSISATSTDAVTKRDWAPQLSVELSVTEIGDSGPDIYRVSRILESIK